MTETFRLYETTFIVRPDIEPEQISGLRDELKDLLSSLKAPQVRWESWGKRKLAYPISNCPKGIYLYVLYLGTPTVSSELERTLKLREDVLRTLTVRVSDRVDPQDFDFELWSARLNPLADRKDVGEFDDVPEEEHRSPRRPSAGDSAPRRDSAPEEGAASQGAAEAGKGNDSARATDSND